MITSVKNWITKSVMNKYLNTWWKHIRKDPYILLINFV